MVTSHENEDKISASSPAVPGTQDLLESLKSSGIQCAVFRKDGGLVASSFHIDDGTASTLSSIGNVADALLQRVGDTSREVEVVMDTDLLVIIPVKSHYLCGILKNRDQKKTLREYADKLAKLI